MKSIKIFAAVTVLSLISFTSFAQSLTATATTLEDAEAKVASLAAQSGSSYTITGARVDNRAYVTARLLK